MKAIILARVSTEEQMNEGQSIPAQLARAREYVAKRGLEIQSEYQFNESSTKDQRVKFEEVIKEIKKSKEKIALIVETVDRLQRSFKESVLLDDLRRQDKVELHFIRENLIINKNSNSSEIQRWDLAVFVAKSYVLQISDNVKRSFEQKIKRGEVLRKAPIGYMHITNPDGQKTVVPDPERAHLIRSIFELYSTGNYSMQSLSDKLKEDGLRGNNAHNKILLTRRIEEILKNTFYYGFLRHKGQLYPHKYEPLISKDLFDKCQGVIDNHHKGKIKLTSNPFIFKGLIKCQRCGCAITAVLKKGRYVYYHCTNYHRNCQKVYVREEVLISPIYKMLEKIKLPQKKINQLVEALKKNEDSKNSFHKNQLARLRLEYDNTDAHLEVMYQDRLEGRLTPTEYDKRVSQYRDRQNDLLSDMDKHKEANASYYITASKVLDLAKRAAELFRSSEVAEKRQLLQYLLRNCELDGEKLSFQLKSPFNMLFLYNTKTPSQREAFLWGG